MTVARRRARALTILVKLLPLLLALGGAGSAACSDPTGSGCCKVCRAGKACGDSCIARDEVCHQAG